MEKCNTRSVRLWLALLSVVVVTITDGAIEITVSSPYINRSMFSLRVPYGFRGTIALCTTKESQARKVKWQKVDLTANNNVVSEDYSKNDKNSTLLGAELVSDLGFFMPNTGRYTCIVEKNSTNILDMEVISLMPTAIPSRSIACSVVTHAVDFTIRVLGTNCEAFEGYQYPIRSEFMNEMVLAISGQCPECPISQDEISITDGPSCSAKVENATLFQGTIVSLDKSLTSSLVCTVKGWQQYRPLIMLTGTMYYVDENCALLTKSGAMPDECRVEESQTQFHYVYIVGGVTGMLLLCLFTFAFVLVKRFQLCGGYSETDSESSRQYSTSLISQLMTKSRSSLELKNGQRKHSGSRRSSLGSNVHSPRDFRTGSLCSGSISDCHLVHPPIGNRIPTKGRHSPPSSFSTNKSQKSRWATSEQVMRQKAVRKNSIERKEGNISLPFLTQSQFQTHAVTTPSNVPTAHSPCSNTNSTKTPEKQTVAPTN